MSRAKNDTYKKEDALADTIINLFADQKFRERLKKVIMKILMILTY